MDSERNAEKIPTPIAMWGFTFRRNRMLHEHIPIIPDLIKPIRN